jgi:RNA polymerase primary sigma factor
LADIGKEGLISAEEEVELARRIKQGDQEALAKLTKTNLRFVVSVAKQYQNQGLGLQDLINEGNLGLIKAAQRFDETRGFKFISFAVWWIRQAIHQAIADQSRIVRLPQNQVGTINKLKKEIAKLEQRLERVPTILEIAEVMDLPEYKVVELLRMNTHSQSMDASISPDEDTKFIDTFISTNSESTDQTLIQESMNQDVEKILTVLPEQERDIIRMCFGIGEPHEYTLEEIGNMFDISRERVRQIKERALKRLRAEQKTLKNKNLATALFS